MQEIIDENPQYRLLSKAKLVKVIRDRYDVPVKEINEWYDSRELSQVYKPTKRKKENTLKITAEPFSFQIDIVKLPGYQSYNKNMEQFLLIVDITSRKAFAYPLKSGKMEDVLEKYEQFMKDVGEDVKSVAGDNFFNNEAFMAYNSELGIEVHTDVAKDDHLTPLGNKLGIVDRLTRTLKTNIKKHMIEFKTLRWTKFLDDIVESYNDTPHAGLRSGFSPNEVFDDPDYAEKVHEAISNKNKKEFESYDFQVGDEVRAQLGKATFEKEKQKYSTEIYTIKQQIGYRYVLEDEAGVEVKRKYRPVELQKVSGVSSRIDTRKLDKADELHKETNKLMRNDLGMNYSSAQKKVEKAKDYERISERLSRNRQTKRNR